jgi:hypothetical protein
MRACPSGGWVMAYTLTGAGTLPEATDGAAALSFLAHRPLPFFANAWRSDRGHRRSSIASGVQSARR